MEESIHSPHKFSTVKFEPSCIFIVTGSALYSSSNNYLPPGQARSPVFPWTSAVSEKTFENVSLSLSHIVLSLILQAHCQRRLRPHPWGDGSAEGPGGHQPVAVRRQLPERRQPDSQSARQNQVRGRGEEMTGGDFEFRCRSHRLLTRCRASEQTAEQHGKANSGRRL